MKNKIKNIGFIIGLFFLTFVACEDKIDPIVEDLQFDRVFTPLDLTARIRNQLTVELSWKLKDDASSYVVEISNDSLEFNSILHTVQVAPEEMPVSILLESDERYSARVKGVNDAGVGESKWATLVFRTGTENIFNALEGNKIGKADVTLSWPAGSEVTHFMISIDGAGAVRRDITEAEVAAGEATITGLTFDTRYTVIMYNEPSPKQRGKVVFTTLPEGETLTPDMDLNEAINTTFASQDVFLLASGEYIAYTGTLTLNRPIKIKGLNPDNKPVVHLQFVLEDGVQDVEIADLEMDGTFTLPGAAETALDSPFQYNTAGVDFGSLRIIGCNIHDYRKALVNASSNAFKVAEIKFVNCVVTNILTDGADGIDFRSSYLAELSLKNSTFNNVAPARDFVRLDNSSSSFPGLNSTVSIDHCTFYGVSSSTSRRLLYVRFATHTLTVTNTLIAETLGTFTNQTSTSQPQCSGNNYFNAPGYHTAGYVSNVKIDISGNFTLLNPGFTNAATGNFTVTNQTLIDNNVGDPRW